MPVIHKIFNGKLNLDAADYRMPESDYRDALNITRDAQGEGQDKVVSNILGNRVVLYTLPAGTNKRIGSKPDPVRNRIYYFVWNSNLNHSILFYDKTTDSITKLIQNLTDTGGADILGFDPSWKINHVDIIYKDNGDILSWTDGLNSPKEINVTDILTGVYAVVKVQFIEAAKRPPLAPPTCVYGSDATRNSNALRRRLFMFSYRWGIGGGFYKTTFSAYSKIPLPIGFYGSDNDIDNTKNNFITVTVGTGDENVTDIEISMRNNNANNWNDFVLVASLNKKNLNIPNNSTYSFLFYNDTIYPSIDIREAIQLFDWLPRKAYTQCLPNGNVKNYGAITENYNNYPVNQLSVIITAANKTNVPPDTNPPSITYTQAGSVFVFTVNGGAVPVGTRYRIYIFFNGNPGIGQTFGVRLVGDYTSIFGDTINSVAFALSNQFNAYPSVPSIGVSYAGNQWQASFGTPGNYVQQIIVEAGSSGGGTISTEKTWMQDCPYAFGIVYVDEQNRDMPGVTTFVSPVSSDNDFLVTTPTFSQSGGVRQTPVISASINHLPPAGAVKYYWVRRRLQYSFPLEYETCDFQSDTDSLYFCLANIEKYKLANSLFNFGTAPINPESRIRILAGISSSAYTSSIWNQDYQILGTVTRTLTGGTSPADDRLFIKVKKPAAVISPAYTANMLVMVYTPMLNPTNDADSVYWEWGEAYDIYSIAGVNYHRGKDQDQTAIQPATFTWPEGDVYFHKRTMYNGGTTSSTTTDTVPIMDENFSDFFNSAVNDNGRAQAIEPFARETYFPTLDRFSLEYQQDTNINKTNRFFFENQDTYDRSFGDIRKMFIEGRYMYVMQKFDVGVVPVLTQVVRDTAGDPLQANSDQLLNKIMYPYKGQFGIGDVPESFAYGKYAKYGVDSNKGVVWRLSQDGMIALSVLYECNAFFVSRLGAYNKNLNNGNPPSGGVYTGNPTVYGIFDSATNKYIVTLEAINRYDGGGNLIFHQEAVTISFLETRDASEGFEAKYSYNSEGMDSLNNLLVSFKNGALWKHDSTTYCNFYGIQYDAYITGVFNESSIEKKTWQGLTEYSSDVWECPLIFSNVTSYGTQRQETKLIPKNFLIQENNFNAAFRRDLNSRGGWINGGILKGNYIVIQFIKRNASALVYLHAISIKYADSPLNLLNQK
jgi:hypothetical protein